MSCRWFVNVGDLLITEVVAVVVVVVVVGIGIENSTPSLSSIQIIVHLMILFARYRSGDISIPAKVPNQSRSSPNLRRCWLKAG